MRAILFAALVTTGCTGIGGTFAPKPGQEQAVDRVWRQLYGETDDPPPIEWVDSDALWEDVVGFTYAGWKVMIAAHDDSICGTEGCHYGYRFSSTPLAHELMHFRTWRRTGDVDPLHFRGDWKLADDANRRLSVDEQALGN